MYDWEISNNSRDWRFTLGKFCFRLSEKSCGFALTIQNFGDEHYSVTQTLDGFLVIQKEGVYYYADENGEASSMKAKNFNLQNEQEKAYLKSVDEKKVKESHAKKNGRKFQAEKKERASWIPSVSDKPKLRLPNPAGHSKRTIQKIAILLNFIIK